MDTVAVPDSRRAVLEGMHGAMSDNLKWRMLAAAIGWLRYDRRCPLVCWERSPWSREYFYRPDVIGIKRDRTVVEIEVKRTFSDFKANSAKRGIVFREKGYSMDMPSQFYFLVPSDLVCRCKEILPIGSGLITLSDDHSKFGPQIECIVGARPNKQATKLDKLAVARMVMHQTATLHRAVLNLSRITSSVEAEEEMEAVWQ